MLNSANTIILRRENGLTNSQKGPLLKQSRNVTATRKIHRLVNNNSGILVQLHVILIVTSVVNIYSFINCDMYHLESVCDKGRQHNLHI